MSGVRILHFSPSWWKFIQIHQYYMYSGFYHYMGMFIKCSHSYVMLILQGRISVLKRWLITPIQNAVNSVLFELKWTGKAFYDVIYWRGYNVILRSCFHQNPFCPNHDCKRTWAASMLILRRRFETLGSKRIQNAVHGSTVHASLVEEDDTYYRRRHVSEFSECLIQAIVRAVNRKGVYMIAWL